MYKYFYTDMLIGFPESSSFVRENMLGNEREFPISLMLHSNRTSEIEYSMNIIVTGGTATVSEGLNPTGKWDVSFGSHDITSNVFIASFDLNPGETEVNITQIHIMNDMYSEGNETFTIRVSVADYGIRRKVECSDDGETLAGENYFCSHTITILDDDG